MAPITVAGTFVSDGQNAITTKTFTIVNVGDLVLFSVMVNSTSINATAVSATKTGPWVRLAGISTGAGVPSTFEIWGAIATATGADTATVTWSAAVTGIFVEFDIEQFHCAAGGANTLWRIENWGFVDNASSVNRVYPSLTPIGDNRVYFGHSSTNSGTASNGSTSGYTYATDVGGDQSLWNPNCPANVAQAPVGLNGGTASSCAAIGLLASASVPTPHGLMVSQAIRRASLY